MPKENEILLGLVTRAQEGDADAFGEIYDLLLDKIYSFVYYKVSHKETAEDLTEEVFIKTWDNLKKFKTQDGVPFSSWVYKIASNLVIDYYRKYQNEVPSEIDFEILDETSQKMVTEPTETSFNQKLLQIGLSKISPNEKDVVVFKYVNDLSYTEISVILDKSEASVRQIHSRALKKLKEILTDYF